jgi:hypothetical protein
MRSIVRLICICTLLVVTLSACSFSPPKIPKIPDIKLPDIKIPTMPGVPDGDPADGQETDEFPFIDPGDGVEFLDHPWLLSSWTPDSGFYTEMPYLAVSWGPAIPTAEVDRGFFKQFTSGLQNSGIHFIGAGITPMHQEGDNAPSLPEYACVDIDGNPINVQKPGMGGRYGDQYWMNLLNPGWQDMLIAQCKAMIDLGVEGLSVDESTFNKVVIFNAGGTFDDYSMNGFREYLRGKYTAGELVSRFEIADIGNFNFRDYILTRGLRDTWNREEYPPIPITHEFAQFQLVESTKFWSRLASELKGYAKSEYGREFFIAFNASPQFATHFMPVAAQDYLVSEHFYFQRGAALPKSAVVIKLAQGLAPRTAVLVEVTHDQGTIPQQTSNLFKYVFADIYSADGRMMTDGDFFKTMRGWKYLDDAKVQYDADEAAKYVRLAGDNPQLFGNVEPAKVGIVHSVASRRAGFMPIDNLNTDESEIKGVIEILLNLNVPMEIIVSGDGELSAREFKQSDLTPFEVVILPNTSLMTDAEVEAVLAYVESGGIIIATAAFGTHDRAGNVVQRPALEPLRQAGSHTLGQGSWYSLTEAVGQRYFWNGAEELPYTPKERSAADTSLVKFSEVLFRYYTPEIVTDAPLTVNIRRYVDAERTVLHFTNYDFDQVADRFNSAPSFSVTVTLPESTSPVQARLYDFEVGVVRDIEFTVNDGKATFEINSLYAYAVVELK